jgi:hypothetical protein
VEISVDDKGQLRQKGVVKKGINVPFDMTATVGVTPEGLIRIHTESVKGFGIPVNPLLKILRVQTNDLIRVDPGHGIRAEGNDLLLDISQLLPPPGFHGPLTSVRVDRGALIQVFGSGEPRPLSPPATSKNHIYWHGGQLSFGKLTMTDTDLELVDDDPRDPFDFSVFEDDSGPRTARAHAGLQRSKTSIWFVVRGSWLVVTPCDCLGALYSNAQPAYVAA